MSLTAETQLLNKLISFAQFVRDPRNEPGPYLFFTGLMFIGREAVEYYTSTVDRLYLKTREIFAYYSFKTFQEAVNRLISHCASEGKFITEAQLRDFFSDLLQNEVMETEVLYELKGAILDKPMIYFGDFTIYNLAESKELLISKYPELSEECYLEDIASGLLLSIKVKAREIKKAIEIADKLCLSFENVLCYTLAHHASKRSAGVYTYRDWNNVRITTCNANGIGISMKKTSVSLPVHLRGTSLVEPALGNEKLWSLITKKKNEIERRILTAVEWIGKGLNEKDKQKALIQFVFAVESLLQTDEKSFISASIVSQLSDWVAFILCNSVNDRRRIANVFKEIYRLRSAVAHGADKSISDSHVTNAEHIARSLIITFLTLPPYNRMQSIKELAAHVGNLKFG